MQRDLECCGTSLVHKSVKNEYISNDHGVRLTLMWISKCSMYRFMPSALKMPNKGSMLFRVILDASLYSGVDTSI